VSVFVRAMSHTLYELEAQLCRVSFYGMKWKILDAEPTLERYHSQMSAKVPMGLNCFDYGVVMRTHGIWMF